VAGGLLRAVGNVLGGALHGAGDSAYELQEAVGGAQHDRALREAVAEIKPKFNQCRRCGRWVCQVVCWNPERSLCKECAPVLAEEMASAQAEAVAEQVTARIRETDLVGAMDVTAPAAAQCAKCGATIQGGRFCAECGAPVAPKDVCPGCGAKVPTGARFCPECGARM
jgi:ribosomal protein L32